MEVFPYMDESLSFEERAEDLVRRMTLEEKIGQMIFRSKAIPHLGIKEYNWWNEALHGIARAGTATVFPQAIALAATFDEGLVESIANVISEEGRAKFNMQQEKGDFDIYKGLTFWSPNINIFRDPRWGRGQETYGEDPHLTSRLGLRFVKGLQGNGKYLKSAACIKHFAVHSGPESLRHSFNAIVSKRDLYETYLPAFKTCVLEGNVEAVMGAYNRTNGEPCCGSKTLLVDLLREKWKFKGHVVSDCWALKDFHENHLITNNGLESLALAINSGCDLNCGSLYLNMFDAYKEGLVSEDTINRSVVRLMTTKLKLGLFERKENVEFNNIPYNTVDCIEHRNLNLKAAQKSIILLRNDGILPLDRSKIKSIGIIGPNANSRKALIGNYEGTPSRYVTISEGIENYCKDDIIIRYSIGCHLYKDRMQGLSIPNKNDRLAEAISIAEISDLTILCLGIDPSLEGELGDKSNEFANSDRDSLELPGRQIELLEAMIKVGKPIVLVSISGSAITYGGLDEKVNALLHSFYPGSIGGQAVASILFGDFSPEGKLPITFYKSTEELPLYTDYDMSNRTYRYMKNKALYPFGYGLSYTTFELSDLKIEDKKCTLSIKNTGKYAGAETIELYIKINDLHAPNYQLKGFKKVFLAPNKEASVCFSLKSEDFGLYDEDGNLKIYEEAEIFVGSSQPDERSFELTGTKPLYWKGRCLWN